MPPKITKLHHAQITIPPEEETAAREFYIAFLGMRETKKPDALLPRGGFWITIGDQQIHIGTENGVDRHATKAHLAYQVNDLAGWRQKLTQRGILIKESTPIPGFDRLEFRDPFGNRIELITPQPLYFPKS